MTRKNNNDDLNFFLDNNIHVPSRTIYFGSYGNDEEHGVDHNLAAFMIKSLMVLDSTEGEINIIMNNIGGDVTHGMAIYDSIKSCKNLVNIRVIGHSMSMGSIILQAGDRRSITKNSKIMIHGGSWDIGVILHIAQAWAKESQKWMGFMADLYFAKMKEKNPKITKAKVKKMLMTDTFLDARESLALGLVDEIV